MATEKKRMDAEDYRDAFCAMHERIETVPEQHQAILRDALNKAQAQHERMQATSKRIQDVVADICLAVEHTRFHTSACRRELLTQNPKADVPF